MATLISIVYKPKNAVPDPDPYTRSPLAEAQLVAGLGIAGDTKGGSGERNLNIMSAETLRELSGEGWTTEPGRMGEQLVVAGLDVDDLPPGSVLQIGPTARITITKPRTGCAKLESHQGHLKEDSAGRLGMMARVEMGGRIAVGDQVTLVNEEPGG